MFDILFELKDEIFNKNEFYNLCSEKGLLLALFLMFIYICFLLLLFICLFPFLPFYFINEKSKEYFSNKSDIFMSCERCKNYCGVACVDGTCPMANRDEYAERGYDIVHSCYECHFYNGCDDCAFSETDMCSENY